MDKSKVGIIYQEMIEAIKLLPLEQQAKIYNALFEYQFAGQITDDDMFVKSFVLSHKTHLDNIIKRRKSNIENGNKGGRPKTQNNPTETQQNPIITQNNPSITELNPSITLSKKQEVKSKKQEIKNKKESKEIVAFSKATTPQGRLCEYFSERYKANTGFKYLSKGKDYIQLAKLVKDYGEDKVKRKIDWLETGCLHSGVFWFAKDINDFNISTLFTQWNYILPKLTDEQKKEEAKRKKEEETKAKVMAELAKQGIKLEEGGNDVSRI